MKRFKVGDQVIITNVHESYASKPQAERWFKMIGMVANIQRIEENYYVLDVEESNCWFESELEFAKSAIINKILSEI